MQPGMLQQPSYPVPQQSSMLQQSSYPVAQQSVMPTAAYPTSATTQLANTTAYQPVQQAFPAVQAVPVPTCGVPTPVCGVPMAQPVVIPQPVQQVQPVQPQIASTQATTAQHKKTTYDYLKVAGILSASFVLCLIASVLTIVPVKGFAPTDS